MYLPARRFFTCDKKLFAVDTRDGDRTTVKATDSTVAGSLIELLVFALGIVAECRHFG
jgi:hypothetical protein